eukprot:TRINITY_DN36894_c0_g1_i1.p3 TRINITY_DN36894_c0_g1~~TRINITY_DN36894_c0_g1_i1.p3  ORF type:complete len:181 (-),score=33.17 TRINITY_DN36894_c0_g1_i1:312-854(-)
MGGRTNCAPSTSVGSLGGIFDVRSAISSLGFVSCANTDATSHPWPRLGRDDTASFFAYRLFPSLEGEPRETAGEPVSVFVLTTLDESGVPVCVWNAFKKGKYFFIETPTSLEGAQARESLVVLLELAEELQCTTAFLCINKTNVLLRELAHIFLFAGFELVHPAAMFSKAFTFLSYSLDA